MLLDRVENGLKGTPRAKLVEQVCRTASLLMQRLLYPPYPCRVAHFSLRYFQ